MHKIFKTKSPLKIEKFFSLVFLTKTKHKIRENLAKNSSVECQFNFDFDIMDTATYPKFPFLIGKKVIPADE